MYPAQRAAFRGAIVAAALVFSTAGVAAAPDRQGLIELALRQNAIGDSDLAAFYRSRDYRPLWIKNSMPGPEVQLLLDLFGSADADGLAPEDYLTPALLTSLDHAAASREGLADVELRLSRAFADYIRDVRTVSDMGVVYGEPFLHPSPSDTLTVLSAAAAASSLHDYVRNLRWMNPMYVGLRQEIANSSGATKRTARLALLRRNLERARMLPADGRYIVVDAAAARLTYYDAGEAKGTMRVVVGTPDDPTPMMVGLLRYATLNPYWHVPPDLTRERIAPRVLSEGLRYFRDRGYEVVDEWSVSAKIIDPATIDWKAVAEGRTDLFVRQRPGPRNGMGKVKFQFPNDLGIYLHDSPAKQLFKEDERAFSAGCVRLEDADALGEMLFEEWQVPSSAEPEQTIALPEPVPVYITYLTAVSQNGRIVLRPDIYGRDKVQQSAAADGTRPAEPL